MPNSQPNPARSNAFIIWSFSTALLTLGLIVFGAVVRVTESGLGCGNDWPLCNGTLFPPLDDITAWIEWLHRLFAVLIGIFGLATLWLARREYAAGDRRVLRLTIAGALLFLLQSALGAIVVFLDLPPTFVTLHLGVAMLLVGALLAAAMTAWYQPRAPYPADSLSQLARVNAAFALLIILTGALVRGSGATLACTDWPQCSPGAWLPLDQGPLALVNMLHRLSVAAMALTLLALLRGVFRSRQEALTRSIALGSGALYLLQIGAGAMFVFNAAGAGWGAAHVGLAAATWSALVALVVIEHVNDRAYARGKQPGNSPETDRT